MVTIPQNDGFVSITAVGGETTLDGDFPIYEKAHVTVKRTRSGTTTTLVLDTDYTIADGELEQQAGFEVVLAGTATPAVAADVYTLLQDVPEARTTDFTQAGDFFAATLNEELDKQVQVDQQLRRDVDKAATLPDTSTISSVELPTPEDSKVVGWDGTDGTMANFDIDDLGGNVVSSYAVTLLDDTSAAAARTTLGLGTMAVENLLAISSSMIPDTTNVYDMGDSSTTWKDLYLGGGIYVGGTGSANFMDDYEVGDWTPAFSSTNATFQYAQQVGRYVKIGKQVNLLYRLAITSAPGGTTSNATFITGVPFTQETVSNMFNGGSLGHFININLDANENTLMWQGSSGGNSFELKGVGDDQAEQSILASQLSASAEIRGSITYISA